MMIHEKNNLLMLAKTIDLHSPERIFKRGYSLTTLNGQPVTKIEDIKKGDTLKTYLQNGVIESVVKE
jgi:exodeoxyribonuclease VII large subunit